MFLVIRVGCVIPLFDETLNYPKINLGVVTIVRHEQGAAHAAEGLARVCVSSVSLVYTHYICYLILA